MNQSSRRHQGRPYASYQRVPQQNGRKRVDPIAPEHLRPESRSESRQTRDYDQRRPVSRYEEEKQHRYESSRYRKGGNGSGGNTGVWIGLVIILIGIIYFTMKPKETHWYPTEDESIFTYQQMVLPSAENKTSMIQVLNKTEEAGVNPKKIKFAIVSDSYKILDRIKPRTTSENEGYYLFELDVEHQKNDSLLMMSYELNGQIYRHQIGEIPRGQKLIVAMGMDSGTAKMAGDLDEAWLSSQTGSVSIQDYQFFGESLLVTASNLSKDSTYELIDNGEVKATGTYGDKANQGIRLDQLEPGNYVVRVNDSLLKAPASITGTWYTVKRNGVRNEIILSQKSGFLVITVNQVVEVPEDVYDLIIDPGHGGIDGGAVGNDKVEAEEVLKVSEYLAKRFKDHGLKVKLTREDMNDPSQSDTHNYDSMPYLENGRVDQVYRYQGKYVISNHLNAFDGSLSGYELYSSVRTTDQWTAKISSALKAINRESRDSVRSEFRQSEGSYKKTYKCDEPEGCDLIYIIRETGGDTTHPVDLPRFSQTYGRIPSYGAESILIEHAYIDSAQDMALWEEQSEQWAEAIVKGTVEYLGIPYQEKE